MCSIVGHEVDAASGKTHPEPLLLEEAALDGIPAIGIVPKADIAELLLTFPKSAPPLLSRCCDR